MNYEIRKELFIYCDENGKLDVREIPEFMRKELVKNLYIHIVMGSVCMCMLDDAIQTDNKTICPYCDTVLKTN